MQGAGSDIGSTNDSLNFMYRALTGDGTIMARLASQTIGGTTNDKVGLMMRETTNANSEMATVILNTGYGRNRFGSRSSSGAAAAWIDGSTNLSLPRWYKLTRVGSAFTGYTGTDGTTWTPIGSANITMSNNIAVGIAVCSRDTTARNTSAFDNVTPTGSLMPPVLTSGIYSNGSMTLSFGGPKGQSYPVLRDGADLLRSLPIGWW